MEQMLTAFLSDFTPNTEEVTIWGDLRLQVNSYLCADLPPIDFITSVRCLLFHEGQVLVVRDPGSQHILPGGRRESGETLSETLRRELLEETGWTIQESYYLGFKHFHHLSPKPSDYLYPHPDFLQVIYTAEGYEYYVDAREVDGYELETLFQPLEKVQAMPLAPNERLYLMAAMKR